MAARSRSAAYRERRPKAAGGGGHIVVHPGGARPSDRGGRAGCGLRPPRRIARRLGDRWDSRLRRFGRSS